MQKIYHTFIINNKEEGAYKTYFKQTNSKDRLMREIQFLETTYLVLMYQVHPPPSVLVDEIKG